MHVITILWPAVDLDLRLPFVAAEAKYRGPNALIMPAHAALETGWGISWFSRERNNLFGLGR